MQLENKRIIITGAARGIGYAVAKACLAEGAHVFATDVDHDAMLDASKQLGECDGRLKQHKMDITSESSILTALESVADWKSIDGLVNNAAILDISDAATLDERHFSQVLDVNLTGALRVTRAVLHLLQKSGTSAIVNTLSTQAFYSVPHSAAYASAKGGLLMLSRSMAVDFAASGVRVNAVAPGFIDTRMALKQDGGHEHQDEEFLTHYIDQGRIPLRRPGTPADCAGAFVFLMSDNSHYITGQVICVDGGLTATY